MKKELVSENAATKEADSNDLKGKEEKISINSLINLCYEKLSKYKSDKTGAKFTLTNIRGIVLHQLDKEISIEELKNNLIDSKRNPYHFYIDTDGTIYQFNPIDDAVDHCRYAKYTTKANSYFGNDLCPMIESKNIDTQQNPGICTVSICLPYGKFTSNTYNSLVKLCAYVINKYSKSLQATENLLSMFELVESTTELDNFKNDTEYYRMLKYDIEKKRANWLLHYGGIKRGYPSEYIYDMIEK